MTIHNLWKKKIKKNVRRGVTTNSTDLSTHDLGERTPRGRRQRCTVKSNKHFAYWTSNFPASIDQLMRHAVIHLQRKTSFQTKKVFLQDFYGQPNPERKSTWVAENRRAWFVITTRPERTNRESFKKEAVQLNFMSILYGHKYVFCFKWV